MATGWLERGRLQGRIETLQTTARRVLEKKFGELAPDVLQRLDALPPDKVEELIPAVLDAGSLADLGLAGGTADPA